jgi:hypothetical protein
MRSKLVYLFLLLFSIPSMAFSQRVDDDRYNGTPSERAIFLIDYLNREVTLSDEQYVKAKDLFLDIETQRDTDLNTYRDDSDFRRVFGGKLDALDNNITAILTPNQAVKYNSIKAAMRNALRSQYSTDPHSRDDSRGRDDDDDRRRGRGRDDDDDRRRGRGSDDDDSHRRGRHHNEDDSKD